jgi:hypothetical protein
MPDGPVTVQEIGPAEPVAVAGYEYVVAGMPITFGVDVIDNVAVPALTAMFQLCWSVSPYGSRATTDTLTFADATPGVHVMRPELGSIVMPIGGAIRRNVRASPSGSMALTG